MKIFFSVLIIVLFISVSILTAQTRTNNNQKKRTAKTAKQEKVFDDLAKNYLNNEWDLVATNARKTYKINYYFNPSKLSVNGNLRQFWIKLIPTDTTAYWTDVFVNDLEMPLPEKLKPETFDHKLIYFEADCGRRSSRAIKEVNYWNTGIIDQNDYGQLEFEPVIPDSNGEAFLIQACSVKSK